MKKKTFLSRVVCLAALACLLLALTACGSRNLPADSGDKSVMEDQQTPAEGDTEIQKTGLEALLGEDYQKYIVDTITEQMDNRMQDMGDVEYYPIRDDAPLTDYVTIDNSTAYELDDEGNVVITFPAGTVADESHGEQSFIIPVV